MKIKNSIAIFMVSLMILTIISASVTSDNMKDCNKKNIEIIEDPEGSMTFSIAIVTGHMQRTNWVEYQKLGFQDFHQGLQSTFHPFNRFKTGKIAGQVRCMGLSDGKNIVTLSSGFWKSGKYVLHSSQDGNIVGIFQDLTIVPN